METETETVANVVETIRKRDIALTIRDGKIIAPADALTPEEKVFIRQHRSQIIDYLANSQSPAAAPGPTPAPAPDPEAPACGRGVDCACYRNGYLAGVQHATDELRAQAVTVTDKPAQPRGLTVEQFETWQREHGLYYEWEPECQQALRDAMRPGDFIRPTFAYSCFIVHPDGSETGFERRPQRKSK